MALPPGVNESDFSRALQEYEDVIGSDWVFTSSDSTDLYRDAYSPLWGEEEEITASAAIAPASTEEVQELVRISNRYKVPIYPISTGKNLGYGGSAPILSGSVVLDLKRMNRILEVNDRNFSCLVEPGVSYFDLYRYIQDRGLKVWIDCPDPGWGSLIGNSLERGCGYTASAYRDHFGAHCGMEIVLANGEVMRTGMGALPGAETWTEYPYGFGPSIDGIFSQSNFGVVTKMGFWLMPEPEAYRKATVRTYNREDIVPLVDIQNYLEASGICNGLPLFSSPLLSSARIPAIDDEHHALLTTPGGPSLDTLAEYGRRNKVPYWECVLQFYGPSEVVDAQWKYARDRFSQISGAEFEEGPKYDLPLTPEQAKQEHQVNFGVPNLAIFFIGARSETNPEPDTGHLWLSPMIPRSGEALLEAQDVFGKAFAEWGINLRGFDVMPSAYYQRSFMLLFGFPITHDVETNRNSREAYRQIVQLAADNGWGEYRTAPAFVDDIAAAYSFNDNILLRFHETVKDAVDPNGILSAGRAGIWPRHLRED